MEGAAPSAVEREARRSVTLHDDARILSSTLRLVRAADTVDSDPNRDRVIDETLDARLSTWGRGVMFGVGDSRC